MPQIIELHSAHVSVDDNGTDISMILKDVKRPLQHEPLTEKEKSVMVLSYLIDEGFIPNRNYRVALMKATSKL